LVGSPRRGSCSQRRAHGKWSSCPHERRWLINVSRYIKNNRENPTVASLHRRRAVRNHDRASALRIQVAPVHADGVDARLVRIRLEHNLLGRPPGPGPAPRSSVRGGQVRSRSLRGRLVARKRGNRQLRGRLLSCSKPSAQAGSFGGFMGLLEVDALVVTAAFRSCISLRRIALSPAREPICERSPCSIPTTSSLVAIAGYAARLEPLQGDYRTVRGDRMGWTGSGWLKAR
jgi:hypothetical protein